MNNTKTKTIDTEIKIRQELTESLGCLEPSSHYLLNGPLRAHSKIVLTIEYLVTL